MKLSYIMNSAKFLFYFVVTNFIGLIYSRFYNLNVERERIFLVGSNYGNVPDQNALSLIDYGRQCNQVLINVSKRGEYKNNKGSIRRGSIKSIILFFKSDVVFCTHGLSDIIPFAHKNIFIKKIKCSPKIVFIQHGIIGLKSRLANKVSMREYLNDQSKSFDLMCVSSNWEKEIVEDMGVESRKIAITGLPRFDIYTDQNKSRNKRTILIAFTWQSKDGLIRKINDTIRVINLCKAISSDVIVDVDLHPMVKERVNYSRTKRSISEKILDCRLLITDDSSIAWDVMAAGGDVLFYKPANNWLVDFEFLLTKQCFNSDELESKVNGVFLNEKENKLSLQSIKLKYNDQQNAKRVLVLTENCINE